MGRIWKPDKTPILCIPPRKQHDYMGGAKCLVVGCGHIRKRRPVDNLFPRKSEERK